MGLGRTLSIEKRSRELLVPVRCERHDGASELQIISGTGKYYFVSKLCKYYFEHVFMRLPASQATDAALE